MNSEEEREKVLEIVLDPQVSDIFLELKDGKKSLEVLSQKFLFDDGLNNKINFLIEKKLLKKEEIEGKSFLSVNDENLSGVMENEKNFDNVIDGLNKLDSYLN